jgi:hypothetical protein
MRAYIEPHDDNEDNFIISISEKNEDILLSKVDLDQPLKWLYTLTNEDGDLVINNSAGMEANKWDHITKEILGNKDNTWVI